MGRSALSYGVEPLGGYALRTFAETRTCVRVMGDRLPHSSHRSTVNLRPMDTAEAQCDP